MSKNHKNRDDRMKEIRRYLDGKMSDKDQNNFERKLQKDPFEEEALEGFSSIASAELDKDIKVPGNKIYSPERCLFLPKSINLLLNGCAARRGDYPKGVNLFKRNGSFIAKISIDGKRKHLGYFSTPELARQAYVKAKNAEIMRKCEQYPQFAEYLANHLEE